METTKKQMSLRESGASDNMKGLRNKLTGWGMVCKARTGYNSASQRRKRNRKGQ